MSVLIVRPSRAAESYGIAADEFARIWEAVCGERPAVSESDDESSDLVLIGSDSANGVLARLMLDGRVTLGNIRYGTDDYRILSCELEKRRLLILAGGRGRSTLYAVYDYFERAAGCRYFWDGDIIPKGNAPTLCGFDISESPRFEYRGLRYFAHRSLWRFQAEHWSLKDWQHEIDWMLKKRLNMFMLRIGMDDLFQKAFPDIVDYPKDDEKLPEAGPGYDDRTTFWPLKYRGELRKNLLSYAFERDLLHPEDCGTMTHWYSRTPIQYLDKVKPTLCAQSTGGYSQQTGLVWDVLDDDNLENYFKLTKAHIENYGSPDIFHTIGFAERRYSEDREVNLRMKLYIYRRICRFLKENYPNAPLMLASWDLWHQYKPDEVRRLTAELDPGQTIVLDYTSDSGKENNFTDWGIVGRFPWVYGIFHGYEPDSDIRGDYALTDKRLELAAADEYCKGLIFWPELSHSDTFMTEYLADNAWKPLEYTLDERIVRYCKDRYRTDADRMCRVWRSFMPIASVNHWSRADGESRSELFFNLGRHINFPSKPEFCVNMQKELEAQLPNVPEMLSVLAGADTSADEFIRRDAYDIARTVCGRMMNLAIIRIVRQFGSWLKDGELDRRAFDSLCSAAEQLIDILGDILSGHEDYSMYETLKGLKAVTYVNPCFEETLKNNASCGYCRSYIYENVRYLYRPELDVLLCGIRECLDADDRSAGVFRQHRERLTDAVKPYYDTPLCDMQPQNVPTLSDSLKRLAELAAALDIPNDMA